MQVKKSGNTGFTLVELMIVVAVIAVIMSIVIPSFVKSRTNAQTKLCIENLRQLQGAIQQLSFATKSAADAPIMKKDLLPYIKGGQFPVCPAGGTYTVVNAQTDPTCSLGRSNGHVLK